MPPQEGEGNHHRARAQKRRQEERPSDQERRSAANLSGHHRWRLIGSQAKRRKNGPLNSEKQEVINGTATIYVFANMVRFDKVHYHTLFCAKIRAIRYG
jgi:hypothetical protein